METRPAPHLSSRSSGTDDFERKYGKLLLEREVADILGLTRRTLQERRTQRWQDSHPPEECGPPYIYVGSGKGASVRYPSVWLAEWMEQRRRPQPES